ncbi:MAG: hypothetical protein K0S58_3517 [Nitrospira sp.]|nr:hypothetical protein [Nitrospira sp.]
MEGGVREIAVYDSTPSRREKQRFACRVYRGVSKRKAGLGSPTAHREGFVEDRVPID